eukprot:6194378-Pleurochrysis_carterae.AAC.1
MRCCPPLSRQSRACAPARRRCASRQGYATLHSLPYCYLLLPDFSTRVTLSPSRCSPPRCLAFISPSSVGAGSVPRTAAQVHLPRWPRCNSEARSASKFDYQRCGMEIERSWKTVVAGKLTVQPGRAGSPILTELGRHSSVYPAESRGISKLGRDSLTDNFSTFSFRVEAAFCHAHLLAPLPSIHSFRLQQAASLIELPLPRPIIRRITYSYLQPPDFHIELLYYANRASFNPWVPVPNDLCCAFSPCSNLDFSCLNYLKA